MVNSAPRVVIVGGGLAGIAAAVRCQRLGFQTTLLEQRPYLGGRAFSFVDRATGVEVDNGQHVFVGACAEYRDLINEIGATHSVSIQRRLRLGVLRNGRISQLAWSRLPKLGMLPSLLKYQHLSLGERLRAVQALMRLRATDSEKERDRLEEITFREWLAGLGQGERALRNLWNLIVLPGLNDDIADVSANYGIMLFQTALMKEPEDAVIGYSRVGLSELAGAHGERFLESTGGIVRKGCAVKAVELGHEGVEAVQLTDGSRISADAVVLAVPHHRVAELLPPSLAESPPFSHLHQIGTAPIVGIHIWYDRPIMTEEFIAVLDSPLQFVFNVSRMHPEEDIDPPGGQHLVISLSGAYRWIGMDRDELRAVFEPEMARCFPTAAQARVTRFLSVKQLNATFRVLPGTERLRPGPATPVRNLFLAGDWTNTSWPSTMESAVRSGNRAADAVAPYLRAEATRA